MTSRPMKTLKKINMIEEIKDLYIINDSIARKTMLVNHFSNNIKSNLECDQDYKSCCYIITFNNNLYYYIGSTTDIKERVKTHFNKIKKIIDGSYKEKVWSLGLLQYFISSEIFESNKNLEVQFSPIYFNTNYLKKFIKIHPYYKLSKGE